MIKRKRRGPISKAVRNLCSATLLDPIDKSKFKDELREIVNEYKMASGNRVFQSVGMVIQNWAVEYPRDKPKIEETWQLVDAVEPKIRQAYDKYVKFFRED